MKKQQRTAEVMEVVIRIAIILGLLITAFMIVEPFVKPILWGVILAVAVYPVFNKLCEKAGGRRKLLGVLVILGSILALIVPAVLLVGSSVEGVHGLVDEWRSGELKMPVPDERVKQWPVVGESVYSGWVDAEANPGHVAKVILPHVGEVGGKLFGVIVGAGGDLIGFTFSLILTGVFLINGPACSRLMNSLGVRLVGESGLELVGLVTGTVRGVALGVVGTATIQAALAALGLVWIGIPVAAVWALLILILAVIQISPLFVLGPIAIYVFSTQGGAPAVMFAVWCGVVSTVDNFIRPVLMGRTVDIPMLVILVGALGGLILAGVMGLFLGAVVVALVYRLFRAWLEKQPLIEKAVPVGIEEPEA